MLVVHSEVTILVDESEKVAVTSMPVRSRNSPSSYSNLLGSLVTSILERVTWAREEAESSPPSSMEVEAASWLDEGAGLFPQPEISKVAGRMERLRTFNHVFFIVYLLGS